MIPIIKATDANQTVDVTLNSAPHFYVIATGNKMKDVRIIQVSIADMNVKGS